MKSSKNILIILTLSLILFFSLASISASDGVDSGGNIALDDSTNLSSTDSTDLSSTDSSDLSLDDSNEGNSNVDEVNTDSETSVEDNGRSQVSSGPLNFTDLQTLVNNAQPNDTVYLVGNYKYEGDSDPTGGVYIGNDINLVGNNEYCIDGSGLVRGLRIGPNINVVLENITFKNCYYLDSGGVIHLGSGTKLTIKNCNFTNNKVYNANAAAIYGQECNTINIYNSNFEKNAAIRESDKPWSQFKKGMASAVLINKGSTLNVYNSNFKSNSAEMATILVVSNDDYGSSLSTIYTNGCLFENNTAKSNAIIYIDELGNGKITNTVFKNNKVNEEGCILMLQASKSSTVNNCTFSNNNAPHGAINLGIYSNKVTTASVTGCTFTSNKASAGAAIYNNQGNLKVSKCKFTSNVAQKSGGAIGSNKGSVKIYDSTFNKNSADKGGALYYASSNVYLSNSNFTSNKATSGGAIFSNDGSITIAKSKFSSNVAKKSGGAVAPNKGTMKVTDSTFYKNTATSGGAIYSLSAKLNVSKSTFSSNKATGNGGAINTDTKGYIKIYNSKFNSNNAVYGGAIFSKLKNVVSSKNTFSKNTVKKTGKDVFGILNGKISKVSSKNRIVKLKVQLSSPWKNLLVQSFKIKITKGKKSYYTKALKTNAKGAVTGTITKKVPSGKYTATISVAGVDFHLTKLTFKV